MNAPVDVMERRPEADTRLGIIDCDIHPSLKPGSHVTPDSISTKRSPGWRLNTPLDSRLSS